MSLSFLDKFGSAGSGDGEFNLPQGISADASYIYVVDRSNHRIQVFDKTTYAFVDKFGSQGSLDGEFINPQGIHVNNTYIYVADLGNDRIQVFNKSTYAFVDKFGSAGTGDGEFDLPSDVFTDANYIYVGDMSNNRVQVFNKSTYAFVDKFGSAGTGDGEFDGAAGIRADDTYIYVIDISNNRVQVFNKSTYAFVEKFGSAGSADGEFNYPVHLEINASSIFVADRLNNRVQVFNKSTYAFVEKFGSGGSGDGQFNFAFGIALYGDLYVTDQSNNRVQVLSLGQIDPPTGLTATCQMTSPITTTFTSSKDKETIDKIEGLLTVENGSATVTGFGTKFTEDLEVGSKIVLNSVVYEVQSITNDTELVLTSSYTGASDDRIEAWIPVTVTFTNTTSITGDATYFWDFGDGTYSTLENPTHTYTDGGTYEATLRAYNMPSLTGTIDVVAGSATVEGAGTSFTTELTAGESLIINGVAYYIQSITDNDTLVLTETYKGTSQAGITAIKRTSKLTGTIDVTNDSTTVTGSGTAFTTELVRGGSIEIAGVSYVVAAIVSDTELTLMNPYGGSTDTGLSCFAKESLFDGAYESGTRGQTVVVAGKGPIDINYLHGDFEISILDLAELAGTVAVTNGSANIVGTGTAFTTELSTLEEITIGGAIYTVYSIVDDTHVTLTTTYTGSTDSGLKYYLKSDKMTGTVNVTNGSKEVVGVGTQFVTDYDIGDTITLVGVDYLLDNIVSDTELILSSVYASSTDTGLYHFRGNSSYTNIGTGPFILNLIDGTQGEVTEYLWDFGDGALVGKTGTVSVTQGSSTVIGSGTLFTSELDEGDKIEIGGLLYRVLNILSDTELVLSSYYAGDTDSGLAYSLKQPGTTSSSSNPELFLTDAGIYELTLEVVKDSTVYTTTKTIQVRATDSSPEEPLSQFTTTQGTGAAPIAGTVGATNGSTTVLGSGTSFATELTEGGSMTIEGITYTIETIISDEELILEQPYIGGTTTSVSLTGTLSVTNGSAVVEGSGTAFTTELSPNQIITIDGVDYTVLEIVSGTELILTYSYDGDTGSALSGLKEEGVLVQGLSGYNGFIGLSALAGTVAVTNGSPKVIGTGTSFTTELVKNDEINIEGVAYAVIGILSDTELILSKAYAGDTDSGLIIFLNSKSAPSTEAIEFTNFTESVWEDLTGTIAVTNDNITVIGSGTAFTTELAVGQLLNIEGVYYTVAYIVDDTELELTEVYVGATDSGLTIPAELVETYFWDFGDGTFSTEQSPTHLYSESGAFEATLTVTTKNGASSYYQTIESVRIDFYAIDIVNHRIGLYSFSSNGSPKLIRPIGRFGNGRAQFNSLNDLIIVGKGKKTLEGMEV